MGDGAPRASCWAGFCHWGGLCGFGWVCGVVVLPCPIPGVLLAGHIISLIGLLYPRGVRDLSLPPLGLPTGGSYLKNYLQNLPNGSFFNIPSPRKKGNKINPPTGLSGEEV